MSHSSSEEGSAENPEQHEDAKDQEEEPAKEQEGKGEEPQAETVTIHIGNLKWEATDNDLRDLFNEFGEIKSVRIPQNDRGQSRGYGFVEFATKEAADAAIAKMDQTEFMGRNIAVSIAANPGERNFDNRDRRGGGDRRNGGRGRYNDRDRGDRRRDHGDRRDRDRGDRGDRYGRGRQY